MDTIDDAIAKIKKLREKNKQWQEKVLAMFQKHVNKTVPQMYKEIGEYQRSKITEMFNNAVSRFYNAYAPKSYPRTLSLYNLLSIQQDENGTAQFGCVMDLIDPTQIHKDRHGGDSLFDTVFMEGWHGGSKYIDPDKAEIWGVHPNPGTPYYRRPGKIRRSKSGKAEWHGFGRWFPKSKPAKQSDAPYKMFRDSLFGENDEMIRTFREIVNRIWQEEVVLIQKDVDKISKEIYG
jgi:hypothetical protein